MELHTLVRKSSWHIHNQCPCSSQKWRRQITKNWFTKTWYRDPNQMQINTRLETSPSQHAVGDDKCFAFACTHHARTHTHTHTPCMHTIRGEGLSFVSSFIFLPFLLFILLTFQFSILDSALNLPLSAVSVKNTLSSPWYNLRKCQPTLSCSHVWTSKKGSIFYNAISQAAAVT